jgi:hypothetical protein
MAALHEADAIFFATHSQGCVVSAHLINRLIAEGHICPSRQFDAAATLSSAFASGTATFSQPRKRQRICCLGLCGIHLGPLAYLHKSSLVMPYIQVWHLCGLTHVRTLTYVFSSISTLSQRRLRSYLNSRLVPPTYASLLIDLILNSVGYGECCLQGVC